MPHDIVEARSLGGHKLFFRFDDGSERSLDLAAVIRFDGVFAPRRDPIVFAQDQLDPEIGTVVWASGADFCPDVLFSLLTGAALPADPIHAHL